jgi:hypothetical protein
MAISSVKKDVQNWAESLNKELKATDPRFQRSVMVIHQDGSVFAISNAFLVKVSLWTIMFSEHNGFKIWVSADLAGAAQYAGKGGPDKVPFMRVQKGRAKKAASSG